MRYGTHDNLIHPNTAIELYNSELIAICPKPSAVILGLRANVHRSHGIPGIDGGSLWIQPVSITLFNGRLTGSKPGLPYAIAHGDITAGQHAFENLIPCPFGSDHEAAVNLLLSSGEWLQFDADQLTIEFTGDPEFIEDFYGE
jgi:hypothetical protein